MVIEANDVHALTDGPNYTCYLIGTEHIQIQHVVVGIAQTNVIILHVAIGDVNGQIVYVVRSVIERYQRSNYNKNVDI